MTKAKVSKPPWNKAKTVGQKAALTAEQVGLIRKLLEAEGNLRDLALFNTAVDTMLRASDLLALSVQDVTDHLGQVVEEVTLRQQKTGAGHVVALSKHSRTALQAWIAARHKQPGDFLFTGLSHGRYRALSRVQYSQLVKKWVAYARLNPRHYSTHSLRRTKASIVYERTRNLAACQHLLGHKSIGSTATYLGVDQRQALDLAKMIDV